MSRTLSLIAIAKGDGLDYEAALALVERMSGTLPEDDIEAGRAISIAASELAYPI